MSIQQKFEAVIDKERALARIIEITEVLPHPNADRMEIVTVGGWPCCVGKGKFKVGDIALYCEIDALLPLTISEFQFLGSKKENVYEVFDVPYARLRTMRLRGELSQGLVVPIPKDVLTGPYVVGENVTMALGVLKYEPVRQAAEPERELDGFEKMCLWISGPPMAETLSPFPSIIQKTTLHRMQNLGSQYTRAVETHELFEASVKLDGDSATAYLVETGKHGEFHYGVCSRNNEISLEPIVWSWPEQARRWFAKFLLRNRRILKNRTLVRPRWQTGYSPDDNQYVKAFKDLGVKNALFYAHKVLGLQLAIQGELVGPGIQGNFEKLESVQFFVYRITVLGSVYKNQKLGIMNPEIAKETCSRLGLTYVPVHNPMCRLNANMKEMLIFAEGPSAFNGPCREGLVLKSLARDFQFKVVSNTYLENHA
jgi:RNA ligase (TIGR02306 family)